MSMLVVNIDEHFLCSRYMVMHMNVLSRLEAGAGRGTAGDFFIPNFCFHVALFL